jgi:hypothetical protein
MLSRGQILMLQHHLCQRCDSGCVGSPTSSIFVNYVLIECEKLLETYGGELKVAQNMLKYIYI